MTTVVTGAGVRDTHVVAPLAEAAGTTPDQVARLSFDNGLSWLDLRADAELGCLLDARFTDPVPVVWTADHSVHIEYPLGSRLLRRTGANAVRISPRLAWSIDVHGGADHLTADLTGVDVRSIAAHAGIAHARLTLGRPGGPCTIRLTSTKDLRIRRPSDVPVRIEVAKGAARVTLDGREFGAVGSGLAEQTPGYDAAKPSYLVLVSGGADTLALEETTED